MITPDDLATVPLFALLPLAMRERVAAHAADVRVNAGEWLVHDGDAPFFWAVLEGEVEVVRFTAGAEQQTTTFDPGEYFGEVPLMLGAPAFSAVRALRPSRLARVEPADFHAIVTESNEASAALAQTLVRRVNVIQGNYIADDRTRVTIVGDRYDFACHDVRDFLSRNQVPFVWLDPADPQYAGAIPAAVTQQAAYPTVLLPDGTTLTQPANRQLAESLGLQTCPVATCYDLAIVGGGPAGLAAAVYGGSEGLRTIMIEREAPGGQAGMSSRIENYLGFPGGISGDDLANRALRQAKRFGTELLVTRSVEAVHPGDRRHVLVLDGGDEVHARAIVIATGVAWRTLESAGAAQLIGRGVYYGAARTEAIGTRGKDVFLVGGGNSAGQAAMYFSDYARSVTLLLRSATVSASMSHYLTEQLRTKSNIYLETETEVVAVDGTTHLESIDTKSAGSDSVQKRHADALFAFIGADAQTQWLPSDVERDARGFVLTGRDLTTWPLPRHPFPLESSVPGIFAAGDVRSDSIKRVASGVGEGSMVVAFTHQYLAALEPPLVATV